MPHSAPAPSGEAAASVRPDGPIVVAIDGPSGSGKSTVARRVAQRLRFRYLDTGAMYRAVAWRALDLGVDVADAGAVTGLAERLTLDVGTSPRRPRIAVDGLDVTTETRSRAVTDAVSAVSAVPAVRARLVELQRALIASGDVVVEGRDIGTTVAPQAAVKVFLTASEDARAARRHRQVARVEPGRAVGDTRIDLLRRDRKDSSRVASPLACPDDAVTIDSTHLLVGDVVAAVLEQCRAVGLTVPPARRPRRQQA